MSLRSIIAVVSLLSIGMGCSKYPISGYVNMRDSDIHPMVYLIDPIGFNALASSYEGSVIDSAMIDDNGNFSFKNVSNSLDKKMYLLTIQKAKGNYPNRLENDDLNLSNYLPFVYAPSSKIIIKSEANSFMRNAVIKSNIPENSIIIQLIQKRFELANHYLKEQGDEDESNLLIAEKAKYDFQKELMNSVADNHDVAINALALRWISTNGDYERIPDFVKQTCQKLKISDPKHPWTVQICHKLSTLPLTVGDTFPDFPLPLMSGDTSMLYTILGKKLTLIDMWASWCAPCRHENKYTLVPLWDSYQQRGFQIVGYALDSSDKGWKNAVEKDGANRWLHASHLKGDVSPLFEKLKISTIPSNYLLNAKGVILAKNLHGDEIKKWVGAYLDQ
ncbi:MAG: TlpA family protein disulfide reductase [Saprospiraceae bacterium]|nr:TlpA family protein disulfide reductase [Saprospiraceae bacterium]